MNGKGSFRINGMGQLTYHAFLFTWFYSGEHSRWKKIVYWDMNAMWKPPVDSDDFIWFAGKVLIGVTACAKSKDFMVQGNWLNTLKVTVTNLWKTLIFIFPSFSLFLIGIDQN